MERKREANRKSLLAAAERLFIESGVEATSMDDVAVAADLAKRTLYQYFTGKEELLFAVAEKVLARYRLSVDPSSEEEGGAHRRLSSFVYRFYRMVSEHPREAAIMDAALALRNSVRMRGPAAAAGEELAALDAALGELYGSFVGAIAEGVADGSLSGSIDPEGAAFAVFFLIKGFLGLVAGDAASEKTPSELHSRDELALYALGLIMEGMKRSGND